MTSHAVLLFGLQQNSERPYCHEQSDIFKTKSGFFFKVFCHLGIIINGEKDIFKYIEVFYNRKRRHASLGYVSPAVYEEMHEMKQGRAA